MDTHLTPRHGWQPVQDGKKDATFPNNPQLSRSQPHLTFFSFSLFLRFFSLLLFAAEAAAGA